MDKSRIQQIKSWFISSLYRSSIIYFISGKLKGLHTWLKVNHNLWELHTHLCLFGKSKSAPIWKIKSDRVKIVALASPIECPGDTVQTGTGKVDPARKFKYTTAACVHVKFTMGPTNALYDQISMCFKLKNDYFQSWFFH